MVIVYAEYYILVISVIYYDIYDIRMPDNIVLGYSDTVSVGSVSYGMTQGNGDTLAIGYSTVMFSSGLLFYQFLPDSAWRDITGYPFSDPIEYQCTKYGYAFSDIFTDVGDVFSYSNMSILGPLSPNTLGINCNFEIYNNQYFIKDQIHSIDIYQATFSYNIQMPLLASTGPEHYGILSTATYGNYILSGAESNGGELLVHEIDQSNQLNLIAALDGVEPTKIITIGSSAICFCRDRIFQVNLANPAQPVVSHFLIGFEAEILDCAAYDSLLFAITDQSYYVIDYDSLNGMAILSRMDFPAGSLTSIGQYLNTSVLLEENLAKLVKINAANPTLPVIELELQLPADTLQNLDILNAIIWASGRHGTHIFDINTFDSLAFLGPEYFSDVKQIYSSNDTLYIADGVNGIKIFTFNYMPYNDLQYKGGYSTGNVINQVCTIGNNFFASDYYSLQHLRWGAPTGIETREIPNTPKEFTLLQNYPNPFNAQTTISYYLPNATEVTLEIYDILGRKVAALETGFQSAGKHELIWDARDASSGVYFYIIEGRNQTARKMVLLR